ncbi:hypothetical protein FO519_006683 [Halicephalobus sp. NKZ332]|nr:hypothetical protein FO519_006683 [Halicephalobus sp. NKZ332]
MSGGIYGVEDISPIVIDPGSHSIRAGYGGQEQPFFDIPSHVGVREVIQKTTDETVDATADPNAKPRKEYFLDTTKVLVPRENTEIVNFMKGGLIEDWDIFEELWDYINNRCLICDTKEHPLLMSESAWNTREKRERLVEIAFEKYKVPATYLMKNAVLTLFSSGRSSGLVLDCGATHTSAVPVHDGFCLAHNVVTQPIGGDTIVEQCRITLENQGIEIVPPYKIAGKEEVEEDQKPVWKMRNNLPKVSKSFEDFATKQVLADFAQSTLQLSESPADVEFMEKLPAQSYCFPCGFRRDFHSERAKIPEALFDLKHLKGENKLALMNVSDIAATSCGMCEPEIRQQMYSNVYVAGGGSTIMGFMERVNHDLALRCGPSVKIRVNGAQTMMERRFGAWIGGSIISCQSQFYNYWISKAEYEECGKSLVEKRCI